MNRRTITGSRCKLLFGQIVLIPGPKPPQLLTAMVIDSSVSAASCLVLDVNRRLHAVAHTSVILSADRLRTVPLDRDVLLSARTPPGSQLPGHSAAAAAPAAVSAVRADAASTNAEAADEAADEDRIVISPIPGAAEAGMHADPASPTFDTGADDDADMPLASGTEPPRHDDADGDAEEASQPVLPPDTPDIGIVSD